MIVRVLASLVVFAAAEAAAQTPTLSVAPYEPAPGSIVRLTLTTPVSPDDSIVTIRGTMAGEPLRFLAGRDPVRISR